MDYETDALPTEPRKHYTFGCYDQLIPFGKLVRPQFMTVNTANCGRDDIRIRKIFWENISPFWRFREGFGARVTIKVAISRGTSPKGSLTDVVNLLPE